MNHDRITQAFVLALVMTWLLGVALVRHSPAEDLADIQRELRRQLPQAGLERPIAAPFAFRRLDTIAARLYRDRVDGVVVVAAKASLGAGALIGAEGTIVTNDHVVRHAHRANEADWVLVWFKPQHGSRLDQAQFLLARVLARDPRRDLALLRLAQPLPANATVIVLADAAPEIGQEVFSIGHSQQFLWSLVKGIISQIRADHIWVGAEGARRIATAIETQTPSPPGSSGAPLLDQRGALIGVVFGTPPNAQGFNLAIDVKHVRELLSARESSAKP